MSDILNFESLSWIQIAVKRELSIDILNYPTPFISATGSFRVADCLVLQSGSWIIMSRLDNTIHGVRTFESRIENEKRERVSYQYYDVSAIKERY